MFFRLLDRAVCDEYIHRPQVVGGPVRSLLERAHSKGAKLPPSRVDLHPGNTLAVKYVCLPMYHEEERQGAVEFRRLFVC